MAHHSKFAAVVASARRSIGPGLLIVALTSAFSQLAAAAPPVRPTVQPGGRIWHPSEDGAPRALMTQDLNSGLTPADLVTALLGNGVTVTNVTFTGANNAAGTFTGGTGIVDFAGGIILSSGDISYVPGPNTQDDVTADNMHAGDADLDGLIPGYTTFDACVLEFDFECSGTQIIQFQYVLSSEEYNEWVNTPYNDVFGFFLNGQNIAIVPGSAGTPVSINNVNCDNPYNPPNGSFCNLYVNNSCADIPPGTFPCAGVRDTQMDGMTVVLTAIGVLTPGVNHIKLAVSDAGDPILDSNVFIQGQSFSCGTPTGACCDTVALTCSNNVSEANCQAMNQVWSVGLLCSQLNPPCMPIVHTGGEVCSSAIVIPGLPYIDVNTTDQKENNYSNSCLGTYDNGNDIIYKLTIPTAHCVDITVAGATAQDNWIGVVVDTVCPPGSNCLAMATTPDNLATISGLSLAPGTYYLMIDRWPLADDSLDYTLSISECGAVTGACCDTVNQTCLDNVQPAACMATGNVWTAGLSCSQLNPPCSGNIPGKDCEYPIVIQNLPYTQMNTTCGKNDDYVSTCLGSYDAGQDVIYNFTNAMDRCVDIIVTELTPGNQPFGVAVDSSCAPGLTCLANTTSGGTTATISGLSLPAGTYSLMIDSVDAATDCLGYTLSIMDCQSAMGACCFFDGFCDQLSDGDCQTFGGVSWTADTPCDPAPCAFRKGDLNCDTLIDMLDVPYFIEALFDEFTGCDITLADMDDSAFVDGADVQLFVEALVGG